MASPASLLARLEELKKWQQQQQERLMKEHARRLQETDRNFSSASDYETIDGLSEYDSPMKSPVRKNRQQKCTIDKQDASKNALPTSVENTRNNQVNHNFDIEEKPRKPKQPYLRRGTGLTRFNMQPGDQNRPFTRQAFRKSVFHRYVEEDEQKRKTESKSELEKCDTIKNTNSQSNKGKNQVKTDKAEPKHPKIPSKNTKEVNDIKKARVKSVTFDKSSYKESSTVMDTAPQITPLKVPPLNIAPQAFWQARRHLSYGISPSDSTQKNIREAINSHYKQSMDNNDLSDSEFLPLHKETENVIQESENTNSNCEDSISKSREDACDDYVENYGNSNKRLLDQIVEIATKNFGPPTGKLNAHNLEDIPVQEDSHVPKTPGEQTVYEQALEKDLLLFEALEKRAMNSSFGSTNSSVIRLLASTPQKISRNKDGYREHTTIPEAMEPIRLKPTKNGTEININISNSSISSDDFVERAKTDFRDTEKWSDTNAYSSESDESNSIVSSAYSKNDETLRKQIWKNSSAQTSFFEEDIESHNSKKMHEMIEEKLHELNTEICNLRKQNAEVLNLRRSLEMQQREYAKDRKKLETEIEEEKMRIEFYLEDEKKKLAKERMVFERYTKELQNKPSRKEREEISALKMEVANLKETLKLKDAKNGNTQARLRTLAKSLEKENGNLKEEVEKLNKLNAKLIASQKLSTKRTSDTKMLHEINKNISKLTKESQSVNKITESSGRSIKKNKLTAKSSPKLRSYINSNVEESNHSESESDRSFEHHFEQMHSLEEEPTADPQKENRAKSRVHTMTDVALKDKSYDEETDSKLDEFFEKQARLIADKEYRNNKAILHEISSNNKTTLIDVSRENDRNVSNLNISNPERSSAMSFKNLENLDLVRSYQKAFGNLDPHQISSSCIDEQKERIEQTLSDGSKEIKYSNGNLKNISPDGNFILMKYYNGDVKETRLLEGTIKYFYQETKTWHTTFADGTELLEFANGQTEKKFKDGSTEIHFPNGILRKINADKSENIKYPDGMLVTIDSSGEKTLHLPNGQKEIHTSDHKRREYPDGTVKILYLDGSSETRYSNGRIRIKDKDGNLILDSHQSDI